LTVVISWFPDMPGDFAERILPFIAAISIAFLGSRGVRGGVRARDGREARPEVHIGTDNKL
jgi:hypothetical protein